MSRHRFRWSRAAGGALLGLLLAATLVPALPAGAESGTRPPAKAPSASLSRPIAAERFVLSGSLGRSVRRSVVLQQARGTTWFPVKRATLPRSGRYRFTVTQPAASASWRVVAPAVRVGGDRYPARRSRPRSLTAVPQTASVTAPAAALARRPVTLRAAFTPVRRGRTVRFDVKGAAGWTPVATTTQRAGGRAVASWTPTAAGPVQVRAVTVRAAGAPASISAAAAVAVLPATRIAISAHATNSYPALQRAIALGPDWIETDFRSSAPNPRAISASEDPVCAGPAGKRFWFLTHDITFEYSTDVSTVFPDRVSAPTTEFTCSEIQQLHLTHAPGPDSRGVLTSSEFVAAVQALDATRPAAAPPARIMFEFKEESADGFADFYDQVKAAAPSWISARDHRDRALFMSFSYRDVFGSLLDRQWTGPSSPEPNTRPDDGAEIGAVISSARAPLPRRDTGVATHWFQAHYAFGVLTPALVQAARASFDEVVAWTPTTIAQMRTAAMTGVDVLTVNDVAMAEAALLR